MHNTKNFRVNNNQTGANNSTINSPRDGGNRSNGKNTHGSNNSAINSPRDNRSNGQNGVNNSAINSSRDNRSNGNNGVNNSVINSPRDNSRQNSSHNNNRGGGSDSRQNFAHNNNGGGGSDSRQNFSHNNNRGGGSDSRQNFSHNNNRGGGSDSRQNFSHNNNRGGSDSRQNGLQNPDGSYGYRNAQFNRNQNYNRNNNGASRPPSYAIENAKEAIVEIPHKCDMELYKRQVQVPNRVKFDSEIMIRPKMGTKGEKIVVIANSFILNFNPEMKIFHYDINVVPELSKPKTRDLLEKLCVEQLVPAYNVVHDGRKNLFSPSKCFGDTKLFEIQDDTKRNYTIEFMYAQVLTFDDLISYINAEKPATSTCLTLIQALDIILRYNPSRRHKLLGSSIYTDEDPYPIGGGLVAWKGFYQSVRPAFGRLIVNVNTKAGAFYDAQPLMQFIFSFIDCQTVAAILDFMRNPKNRNILERFLRNIRVKTNYHVNRKYIISGLGKTPKEEKFPSSGQMMTVEKYYFDTYKIKLNYASLPCITVNPKKSHIPIECCLIVAGQAYRGKLNDDQTSKIMDVTRKSPNQNFYNIQSKGKLLLQHNNNPLLETIGLNISEEFVAVNARVLPAPTIQFKKSIREPNNGSYNMKGLRLYIPIELKSWAVLEVIKNGKDEVLVNPFCDNFTNFCKQQELPILSKPDIFYGDYNLTSLLNKIREIQKNRSYQIIFILAYSKLPKDIYNGIKRLGDTEIGVHTQCVISAKNITKGSPNFYTNIILKVNSKLGGTNLKLADNHFMESQPTIIFGADVTHPAPGSNNDCKSVAAVVWSMDNTGFQYDGSWDYQEGRKEMITKLDTMVLKGLQDHCKKNPKTPPKRLIFFRDGVSDGQLKQVLDLELPLIKKACAIANLPNIAITLIVTQKRHNHRFDAVDDKDRDPISGNLKSGVVIETGITHPTDYDFYLLSHAGLLGTSRPCYYRVLKDKNAIHPDELQEFIYNGCFLFARCTRAVSLFPAVYYADCLCDRGRRCMDESIRNDAPVKKTSGMAWI
jgi:eukaryotic translation initiation factor 2C